VLVGMKRWIRLLRWLLLLLVAGTVLSALAVYLVYRHYEPTLPEVAMLREIRFQVPLKVYSRDGKLIANFGEARRFPSAIEDVPEVMKQAFIATEDERFYQHPGVDYQGMARVAWEFVRAGGEFGSGGSTITMQLARNFFLSPERKLERKLREILLALKIERELSKDEILGLYLNKIFLGNRAYGVAAAAQVYYGKSLAELSLTESAMIAGLPKAPSDLNPIQSPTRALERRNYVLSRMRDVGYIDAATFASAIASPETAHIHELPIELEAPYVAEMARIEAERLLGSEEALTGGYSIYTTIDSTQQIAANHALREALSDYEERHGYRGPEAHVALEAASPDELAVRVLKGLSLTGGLIPALVISVDPEQAGLLLQDGSAATLDLKEAIWARRYLTSDSRGPTPKTLSDVIKPGDVIRVRQTESGAWRLTQIPAVQGALVSLDPENGAIRSLVGGFSFGRSKFNRATQSERNPGSSFKPFVYSSAFEKGFTPASIVNDAPIVFEIPGVEKAWRPQNDNETFSGPIRLREAMVRSKNLVSIRILDAIGVGYARKYIERFGFDPKHLPENLSLALGTASAPPLTMARGYAVFANGGYLVDPFLIDHIDDSRGDTIHQAMPALACATCPERVAEEFSLDLAPEPTTTDAATVPTVTGADAAVTGPKLAPRVIDARNAYMVTSLMMDVVKRGTGRRAMELGRNDLAGKTGTTNDHRDAWFSGFNQSLVATAWMGFDDFSSLGNGEFASKTALPMWIGFMGPVLEGQPQTLPQMPTGITTARINSVTGQLTSASDQSAIMEIFRVEDVERLGRGAGNSGRQDPYEVF
jgi:penicillin-binding protein 1A